jgi:citrate lyase gamma subunit
VYGSGQDIEDALGIYVRQRKRLGLRRMRQFADRQGVLEALRELERKAVEIKDGDRGTLEQAIARARSQIRAAKTVSLEQLRNEDE